MAQLIVRDVDEALVQALRLRAAANGRSAEAEHRMILRAALAPALAETEDFAAAAARLRARLAGAGTDAAALVRAGRAARE
jgi:plasmid stability protein